MGTWGPGPFDDDTAADLAGDLDETLPEARPDMIREVLERFADAAEDDDAADDDARVVAAVALVAAQCPAGVPVTSVYGPDERIPQLAADLRETALKALNRVEAGWMADAWFEEETAKAWRLELAALRRVLDPPGKET